MCIGLVWQRLVVGGGYRGGFCEKLLKASTVPKGANASQLWHNRIKKGGNNCATTCNWREEWENVRETAVQTPRSVKEGEEVLQSRDSPAASLFLIILL